LSAERAAAPAQHGPDPERVFASVRWVAAGQVASQGGRLLVSIALARLLSPHDFGLLTMAAVFTAVGQLLSTLGAGPAIVQRPVITEGLLRSLATLGLAIGFGLWLLFALASGAIATFFGEPAVATVVAVLAGTFAFAAFGMVPEGLLQRELRFGRLVAIDMASLVVSSVGALGMAAAGYGVWSLVVPNLLSTALRSALLVATSSWPLRLGFDSGAVAGVLGFSSSVLGFNGLLYFTRNADRLIIGRALGAVDLGLYDYAYRFYMYPVEVITGVLINVMFPTFARLQESREELGRAFLRANGAIALITFPMMTGLAVVAGPFVRVVLGDQWTTVIPLVRILAPLGAMQSLGATPGQIFLATGNAALRLRWAVIYTTVIVASFAAGLPWGILGVASAYAVAMVPITLIGFWLALRLVDLRLGALGRTLAKTIAASAAMAVCVAGLALWLRSTGVGDVALLLACVPFGVAVYGGLVWALRPDALEDIVRVLPARLRIGSRS
jgi:O-antigen/teichoic acid export membrane protein